ncbi:hypothetical protein BHE74_00032026 [Ensete ventricosum]|nr:hypothetical protein GW17_00048209 [Ensete ventricosum]RWW60938.1 hypothetical protein BHE74_00032026 [Ensete ventricosum]RZR98193.1 hypothetical protein BHM03_00027504 [Ensete ventricosum]
MASASLLKSSPIIEKSEWVKGAALRHRSASVADRSHPATSLAFRAASSYADELVKTAVRTMSTITFASYW